MVYTPNEIVRFMIDGADWLCEQHFGKSLIERDVEILDPATGTGTFICELLEHFRGQPKKLERKYKEELHANEVAILPYYVANLNIEATYAAITGKYDEFANLCFVDTLDNVGLHTLAHGSTAELFGSVSDENVARIKRQNSRKISVIIGNPPYNANQANENDNNKNREYPAIDARIKQTYIAESTAQKTKLYDMYARFFRWASDRLDANGVLAFVTHRSFLDSRTFDGLRKTAAAEFAEIRVVDLGGDVRANSKLSGTKHNVFGIQTVVAIGFFVKKAGKRDRGRIFYARRPELETAEEKLAFLSQSRLATLACEEVRPDAKANWLNLTHNDFDSLMPIADKEARSFTVERAARAVFRTFSLGASTNRDEWLMDFAPKALLAKTAFLGAHYESRLGVGEVDETIKWSETLLRRSRARQQEPIELAQLTKTLYRPYVALDYYNSPLYVDRPGRASRLFLQPNRTVCFMAGDRQPFSVIAAGALPNLNMFSADACQCVPEWEVAPDGGRIHNTTDWALKQFTSHYKAGPGKRLPEPSKEGIFHYVYAVLHDPVYRETYAQNLKREFPHVPLYGSLRADFWRWADWGRALMELHIGYEAVETWPLQRTDTPDAKARTAGQSPKCILKSEPEAGRMVIDSETTLSGLPPQAWTYRLGNRSAIDWVLDQHKERKPKDPTIREKFDTYRFADHKERIIDLLARVVRVSVETLRLVDELKAGPRS